MNKLLKSPWLELIVMCGVVILSYIALMLISIGAETPPGGMSLNNISLLTFGFFLLSFAIAAIAVLAGIGGGVLFTPLMLAFTPVNSLIVRGTGLIVAMFSRLVIGCACACLALLGVAIAFLREKPRCYGWALVSLFVALMVLLSALGMYYV